NGRFLHVLLHTQSLFFSSRRRHTRSTRDWSSDVCSSDWLCQRQHRSWLFIAINVTRQRRRANCGVAVGRAICAQVIIEEGAGTNGSVISAGDILFKRERSIGRITSAKEVEQLRSRASGGMESPGDEGPCSSAKT